jgi:hypothetical protein
MADRKTKGYHAMTNTKPSISRRTVVGAAGIAVAGPAASFTPRLPKETQP